MTLTDNERSVLRAILTNDFTASNGAIPDSFNYRDWVWSNCIDCAREVPLVKGKALSGVCGSLAQKGLIETDGNTGRDACIALTEAGYAEAIKGPVGYDAAPAPAPEVGSKSVKLYSREAASDPFVYVGSVGTVPGDVDYEGHAKRGFDLRNCEVLAVIDGYAYTFNV